MWPVAFLLLAMVTAAEPTGLAGLKPRLQAVDAGWPELFACLLVVVFVVSFFRGKRANRQIANAWYKAIKSVLEMQFAKIGAYHGMI
jgi:hypothetical protein